MSNEKKYYLMKKNWLRHEEWNVRKITTNLEELKKTKKDLEDEFGGVYGLFQVIGEIKHVKSLEKRKKDK